MCALNEVKQYLSQTTEHGQGSSPKVLIEAIMSISKLSVSDCDDCDVPNYYICGQCEYGQGGSGLYEGDQDYFILMVNGDKFYPNKG